MPMSAPAQLAIRQSIPLMLPVIPFALVLGVAISESEMPTVVGWLTNPLIFAGAAQLATVTLAATATWLTLIATAAVINLRHTMYSAALAPRFRNQPTWFRWVGPYLLIDQVFALASLRDDLDDTSWRRYYLASGTFFITSWHIFVTVGLFVGSAIPEGWRLDVAPAVMFVGLVAVGLRTRPAAVAAIAGATASYVCLGVPNNGGILIGAFAGITAGYLADRATT